MKDEQETNHAFARSLSNAGLGVLTTRDCFAMSAMQSLIESNDPEYWWMNSSYSALAKYSYRIADAMMKRRGSTPNA